MVRNDDFFLGKWIEYYGNLLGKENLFIYVDGEDQKVPSCADACNVTIIPRVAGNVRISDKQRIDILSARAAQLLRRYDMIVGTDVDEFLVVDPALKMTLPEFLYAQNTTGRNSLSGLGCDVIYNSEYGSLDRSKPLLGQRRAALLSTRYTKTSVLCAPVQWGSGFHRTRKGDFHICKGLYLFHFGCADPSIIGQKVLQYDPNARQDYHVFDQNGVHMGALSAYGFDAAKEILQSSSDVKASGIYYLRNVRTGKMQSVRVVR